MLRKLSVALVVVALAACSKAETSAADSAAAPGATATDSAATPSATTTPSLATNVMMRDAAGRDVGTLTLSEAGGAISLSGTLRGLPPGTHAIHLHTTGQCVAPFESAGPHWNPTNKLHGIENTAGPHHGDMPNITVAQDSTASVNVSAAAGTLRGADALLDADGAAAIIHAKADDLKSDPAGNSGDKIACGTASGV